MASPMTSTTLLHRWQPHLEVSFADTHLFRCRTRLSSIKTGGIVTSLSFDAVLSTADLYSVIFPFIRNDGMEISYIEMEAASKEALAKFLQGDPVSLKIVDHFKDPVPG